MTRVAWEEVPTDLLASDPSLWELRPGADWHGFKHVAPGWAMTDPNKLIVLTPGFDTEGRYTEHGVPAPVVAEYLRQNRIVCEKNDLNSLLFLLTPGVESSKAGTLLSHLVSFKKLYDDNALELPDVSTHYVVLAYQLRVDATSLVLPDSQHGQFRWMSVNEILGDPAVHANTRAYFE
jgi:arginine/lysine/ornithine decarboxylase